MFAVPKRVVIEIAVLLTIVIGGVLLFSAMLHERSVAFLTRLRADIDVSHAHLVDLRTRIGNNATTDDVAAAISDCTHRNEFEKGLGDLLTSSPAELQKTKTLYAECGDYYALRKSVMVVLLQDAEYDFRSRIHLLASYTGENPYSDVLTAWDDIVALEKDRSNLQQTQVLLQGAIIDELILKKTVDDDIHRAQETAQFLQVKSQQAGGLSEAEERAWDKRKSTP